MAPIFDHFGSSGEPFGRLGGAFARFWRPRDDFHVPLDGLVVPGSLPRAIKMPSKSLFKQSSRISDDFSSISDRFLEHSVIISGYKIIVSSSSICDAMRHYGSMDTDQSARMRFLAY